ncbi:MAG TPA: (Fe-S)-binding protein, partial [Limnochordales bacterium]
MQAQDRWLPRAGEVSYRCIRCGFCLPSCPTFRLTGLETEGPRGRIALVRAAAEGRLPLGEAVPHLERCLGCRACEAACPVGVPYGQLLEGARAAARRLAVTALPERLLRAAMGQAVASPGRLRAVAWAWWAAQRTGLAARLAGWVGMAAPRSLWRQRAAVLADTVLALPAARPPWQLWAQARSRGDGAAGVALFAGCIQELFFSPVNRAAARVLAALGYPVRTLVGGGCCGAVHAHLGMPEVAARLARRNIEAFERSGARWLVVAAGGCYAFLREYPLHVACGAGRRAGLEEPERLWVQRAERFRERVREFSEFVEQQQLPALQPPAAEPITVSYQDSCHLRHVARLQQAPR